jgi:hypothetical protein
MLPMMMLTVPTLSRSLVYVGARRMAVYAYSASAKAKGLFLNVRIAFAGRRSVAEGASPNSALYSTAKRPSSQKPFAVAILVTLDVPGAVEVSHGAPSASAEARGTGLGPCPNVQCS